jgi:DNA-binding beta-propeller fold protein YncE
MKKIYWAVGLVVLTAAVSLSQRRVTLPKGQALQPAGRQVSLDTFPMAAVLTPNKRHLLVLHGGVHKPSVIVFDPKTMTELSRLPFDDAWLGIAVHPNSHTVYVGGASRYNVHELTLTDEGRLIPSRVFEENFGAGRKPTDFFGDLALSPDGRLIYLTDLYNNAIKVINPQSGRVIENWRTARRPYKILFHPDGKTFFVSSWADGTVTQHDAQNGVVINRAIAGPHATDMVWREKKTGDEEGESDQFKGRIFVTLGNTNSVRVLGVSSSKEIRAIETINVALYPDSPAGMTPSALALSEDNDTLYVVCSDANAVAAVNVSSSRSRVMGFIPTGWYPTAARSLDDRRLLVLNGKGMLGSGSVVETGDPAGLIAWTEQVRQSTPYIPERSHLGHRGDSAVIPAHQSERSPIEHVVYIVKGHSIPSKVTPNLQKLATEFARIENFHVIGETPAEAHNWATAAIASDYVQRLWPNSEAGRRRTYDYEGGEPAAMPAAGYIWSNAVAKGLRFRNYGYFVTNRPLKEVNDNVHVAAIRDEALAHNTNRAYRGPDPGYLDIDRAKVYITDLGRMEGERRFPQFSMLRLGSDEEESKRTPVARTADSDAALGMIVEALSRSTFWPKMAIFVVDGAARSNVAGRSTAFVISPYARRGAVDSSYYNTLSVLRTMELILGLRPMTMHDAGAQPMVSLFTPFPDLKTYSAERPNVPLEQGN